MEIPPFVDCGGWWEGRGSEWWGVMSVERLGLLYLKKRRTPLENFEKVNRKNLPITICITT